MTRIGYLNRLLHSQEEKPEEPKSDIDSFEEKDPKEKEMIRKARINTFLIGIVFVVIGLVSTFQGITMGPSDPTGWLSNILFLGGLITLFFGGATLISALAPIKEEEPLKVTSELRCRKCDFKATRDFKRGDFIFLESGTCMKCQAPTYIWGIYSNPPLSPAEEKILVEDL